MRVTLPHELGREEVRKRLRERSHEIASFFPPGMASVDTGWPHEDRMDLTVTVVGQKVSGGVEVAESHVVIDLQLPAALGFLNSLVEKSVRKEGGRLLEKR